MANKAWGGILPADFQERDEAAELKKQLALQLLQQQAANNPQGQMISGRYVKSSPMQHLAKLAQQWVGQQNLKKANEEQAGVRKDYEGASQRDLERVLEQMQGQEQMGPPEDGQMSMPRGNPNPMQAERLGVGSRFPQSQALGKALMEQRMKAEAARDAELSKRVTLEDLQKGNLQGGAPRLEHGVTDGIHYSKSEAGINPLGSYRQGSMPGADGRPMAVQTAPFGGKVDAIDKAPKVSATATANAPKSDDPFMRAYGTELGGGAAKVVLAGLDAADQLPQIERIKELHIASNGQYTAGPAAGPVRLIRDLASQMGIPIDPKVDLNNVKLQAEFTSMIAKQIIGVGRGLTDEDRQVLEKTYPGFHVTPSQMPAFLNQYEKILRDNIKRANSRGQKARDMYGGSAPVTTQQIEAPPGSGPLPEGGSWSEAEEREYQELKKKLGK
jgi:hypothetical protein